MNKTVFPLLYAIQTFHYFDTKFTLLIFLIRQNLILVYSSFEWNSLGVLLIILLPYKSLDRKCCEHNSEKDSKGKSRFLLASCWPETDINQHCSTGILLHAKSTLGRMLYILQMSYLTAYGSFALFSLLVKISHMMIKVKVFSSFILQNKDFTTSKTVLSYTKEKVNLTWCILQFRNIKNVAFVSVIYDELVARQLLPKQ